jgi:cytoskeletal protein CcmA (bactofilin family)
MIRMGRGSRPEQPETTNYPSQTPSAATPYQYTAADAPPAAGTSRVVTDSESMARDIKEGRLSGFVGHGTVLSGETNFQAMLRVDGHLVGSVTSESGTLIVGTQGQVDASVSVSAAMINGTVNGDIIATERIQLGRTARVVGNIQAPRLMIEEGAILEGGCIMLKARENLEKQAAEAENQYKAAQQTSYGTSAAAETDESDEYLGTSVDDDDDDDADEDDEETAEAAAL